MPSLKIFAERVETNRGDLFSRLIDMVVMEIFLHKNEKKYNENNHPKFAFWT